ncbi:uncharacterized protein LOC141617454 [Silene latifolia]|uniref:uncharacterized protein LOC141617454 n=1 Tax=Silene latifolia TaxID=37657 RepID=UPI003D787222
MGWKSLSKPKQASGIGIKEVLSWNGAQMDHWIWKLYNRPENIWAKRVHHYVLKGTDFWLASTSVCTKHGKFKAGLMYDLIRDSYDLVHWAPLVFDKVVAPKHSFMGMMALPNRLPTIDNLVQRGLHLLNRCVLCCNQGEDLEHLFFSCPTFLFSGLVQDYVLVVGPLYC